MECRWPANLRFSLLRGFKKSTADALSHGVQQRMISVDNFFVFLRLLFFAVLLLYVTLCAM